MSYRKCFSAKSFALALPCLFIGQATQAGPADPSAAALEAIGATHGTRRVCLPSGFFEVQFLNASGGVQSRAESSTSCVVSSFSSSTVEQRYGATATHMVSAFLGDAGMPERAGPRKRALVELPKVPKEIIALRQCEQEVDSIQDRLAEVRKEQAKVESLIADVDGKLAATELAVDRFPLEQLKIAIGNKLANVNSSIPLLKAKLFSKQAQCAAIVAPKAHHAVAVGADQLSGSVVFSESGAGNWQHQVEVAYTHLSDKRSLVDRSGDLFSASLVSSYATDEFAFSVDLNATTGDLSSDATATTLKGNYFSIGASVSKPLHDGWLGGVGVTLTHGENDIDIGGGTGQFSVQALSLSTEVAKAFDWQGLAVTPSFAAGATWMHRGSYTDSNGLAIPGESLKQATVSGALSFSKTLQQQSGFATLTPSLRIGAQFAHQDDLDAELPGGGVVEAPGLGGHAALGIEGKTRKGASFSTSVQYSMFESNLRSVALSAAISVPFE